MTGLATSTNFPLKNPIQATNKAPTNGTVFAAELNPAGNGLVYSTYLGGSVQDVGTSIAVDASGAAYVTGFTNSTDFPTKNPIQSTQGGNGNAIVAKIAPNGTSLVYSTYLGGSGGEAGEGIAVDRSGDAYVTGGTSSGNFPTMNPIQASNGGGQDIFVSVLNPAGSALLFSTYLGGSGSEFGQAIAADNAGDAYITGTSNSPNFPQTSGNFGNFASPDDSAFGAKLVTPLPVATACAVVNLIPLSRSLTVAQGTTVQISAVFSDPNTADSAADFSESITWGDGTSSGTDDPTVSVGGAGFTIAAGHLYAGPGTYQVTMTVQCDSIAATAMTTQFTVTVTALAAPPTTGSGTGTAPSGSGATSSGGGSTGGATSSGGGGAAPANPCNITNQVFQTSTPNPVVGVPFTVIGGFTGASGAARATLDFDWGDGTPPLPVAVAPSDVAGDWNGDGAHIYQVPGSVTITTGTVCAGQSTTGTLPVVVLPPTAPSVPAGPPVTAPGACGAGVVQLPNGGVQVPIDPSGSATFPANCAGPGQPEITVDWQEYDQSVREEHDASLDADEREGIAGFLLDLFGAPPSPATPSPPSPSSGFQPIPPSTEVDIDTVIPADTEPRVVIGGPRRPVPGASEPTLNGPLLSQAPLPPGSEFQLLFGINAPDGSFAGFVRRPSTFIPETGALRYTVTLGELEQGIVIAPVTIVPAWVENFDPDVHLWSGPFADAVDFGVGGPQFTTFTQDGPQVAGRIPVYNPLTQNYAWIDASGVGPSAAPTATTGAAPAPATPPAAATDQTGSAASSNDAAPATPDSDNQPR